LVGVKKNNVTIASFVYDGDGKRVKSTINGVTTSFVGQHYEVTNNVATKYYFAGASRIAMQTSSTLTYLLTDHLNSTSITTNSTGGLVSELRYKPWGETRFSSGTTSTKYQYTGQFSYESDFGLMFYNARFYDSQLGRFTSADSIIPESQGVQAYDRYAYANNNPLKYTDPTGHFANIFIGMGIGFVAGAAVSYLRQAYNNSVHDGGWSGSAFSLDRIDMVDVGASALVGAGAGGLIGSGVGAGAGIAMISGETAMAAGAGMASSALGYTFAATVGEDTYSTKDMMGTAIIGGLAGAASSAFADPLVTKLPVTNPTGQGCLKWGANAFINFGASTAQGLWSGSSMEDSLVPGGISAGSSWLVDILLAGAKTPRWAYTPITSFIRSTTTEFVADEITDAR
jgi:RHS repeat-associated protein